MNIELASPELMVCETLRAATDPNHEVVLKAEAQLAEWETQPGFFSTLARFAMHGGNDIEQHQFHIDLNVRWMAAVYLKNGINKYWRRNARNELPNEEKQQIRQVLLKNFSTEPVPQVALQIAVLIARIARIDCPRDWPELIPQLVKQLQMCAQSDGDAGEQQRVLLILHHVIKALASRRMMAEKRVFEELAGNLFVYMQELWDAFTTLFFHQLKTASINAISTLERALLSMRILRKLTIYGFPKPFKVECCMHFLEQLFTRLKQCLECRYELQHLGAEEQLIRLIEKFILKQMKTLTEFQDMHSSSFGRFVPVALEFSFEHVFHEGARLIFTDNVINFSNFAIHCINLMKGIMMCSAYANSVTAGEHLAAEQDAAIHIALSDFFTNERLCYISDKVITHYFLLTQNELDQWMEDPEGFAQDDGGESWKYALRPCIESFFLTCFSQYQSQMTSEVVKYIRKAQQIELTPASDLKDMLQKDAIYNAAGLASFHFFNDIDFDSWFSNQLLGELRIESDNFRILRRRIIWLVAEWAAVKFSRNLRPLAYEACLHLLRPTEDMSIRLAASRTLSTLIGDFEFAPEHFLPYLEPCFNALFVLLGEARECDTKMNVLTIMSCIVEKMSDNIELQADNLISYLPLLWKESEDFNMLRCAIICTLQQLAKALRDIPESMKPFLYNVIQLSTDLQELSYIYLMEEGLALWVAVVENSTVMSTELLDLCKNLLPIIEMSSENLRIVLILIQAYILLDAHSFLERYGKEFVQFCARMFDDLRPEGITLMLKVFETCLKSDANYGLELVRPALPYIFKQVYLDKEFPILMSMYLMMVARVLLISQSVFTAVLQELQLPNALETILDVWIRKMPLVTEVEKRKLFALSFASIFTNNSIIIERFPAIMQNIGDTLMDVMREEDNEVDDINSSDIVVNTPPCPAGEKEIKFCDSLVFLDEHDLDTSNYCIMDDFDYKTYHYDRCRQLSLKDPVHKIVLTEYLEWQLNTLRMQMGEEAYKQLMQSVYSGVLEKIGKFIKLNLNFQPN
ncbi:importin-11 [Bactrocera neohumeralis]|uniref:importin-11 n=1 Tax=Bactrocera neohumeralis TaxID=98809 RepID=UPI0021650C0B|nr:importin-11 [Bactrocera neohumeralis]XP_050322483.1 importin-11 [Bactrocera neohumeralis]